MDPALPGLIPVHHKTPGSREIVGAREWWPKFAVGLAILMAQVMTYSQTAVKIDGGPNLSFHDVNEKLIFSANGWVATLGWFGAILAALSAFVFPESERFARSIAITAGSLVAMVPANFIRTHLDLIDENATGIGTGLILAWAFLGIAAVIPWLSVLWFNRQRPVFGRDWAKWLFLLPAIVWILALTIFPLIYAFTTSRYAYRNGKINRFVGWDNYRRMFDVESWGAALGGAILWAAIAAVVVIVLGIAIRYLGDKELTQDDMRSVFALIPIAAVPAALVYLMRNVLKDPLGTQLNLTLFFVVVSVAIEMVLGFMLALLMNRELRARGTMRAIMTLPIFATPIGIGYLARSIFYEEGGPVNAFLENFGFAPPWLSDPEWARAATIIVDVWQWTPFVFIIALAGLQGLPQDVIEASEVDGANAWQVLRYITFPLMAPILWLILLLRTIDGFKVFDIPSGLTLGGPGRATEYFSLFNYRTARKFFNYGEAASQAFLLLFLVMLLVSLLWGRIRDVYEQEEVTRA